MKVKDNIFSDLIKFLPEKKFHDIVGRHNGDKWSKKTTCWDVYANILYGQLVGEMTLRSLNINQYGFEKKLAQIGVKTLPRSTLSDACKSKSYQVFLDALLFLINTAHRKLRQTIKSIIKIIDSTSISLLGVGYQWAKSNSRITGLKTHVVFDLDNAMPDSISFSDANINDVEEGKKLKLIPNTTYCFDRGYCDFKWWKKISTLGSRFITRLKSNTPYKIKVKNKTESNILHDWIIEITSKKRHYLGIEVRHIKIKMDTGGYISIISNDLTSDAAEIANIYKLRWQIELFFKWIKGRLKIKHFISKSENGVKIQVTVAMIAYVLIRLAQEKCDFLKDSMASILTIIRRHLFTKGTVTRLLSKFKYPHRNTFNQEALI